MPAYAERDIHAWEEISTPPYLPSLLNLFRYLFRSHVLPLGRNIGIKIEGNTSLYLWISLHSYIVRSISEAQFYIMK